MQLASFSLLGEDTPSSRSVTYLEQRKGENGVRRVHSATGPAAIEHYLEAEKKGRLIQSLKSYLASRTFTGTSIFGRHYTLERLVSQMLSDLREHAERQFGRPVRHALAGRPIRFVGAENDADDAYAVARLRSAFELAGFESVEFEFEPVAAAYSYESTLDHDELILIGDFGGGTSDFSLLRVGPGVRRRGRTAEDMLGISGVALAGDAFDARIVRKLVSPALGSDSLARSLNKTLPAVPAWIYSNLERWHYLSFLRTRDVMEILRSARLRALEPKKIQALTDLIEEDLGYQLHQAVQRVKFELSHADAAEFRFSDGSMNLHIPVTRADFEAWIAERPARDRGLHRFAACVFGHRSAPGRPRLSDRRNFVRSRCPPHLHPTVWRGPRSQRERVHLRRPRSGVHPRAVDKATLRTRRAVSCPRAFRRSR